MATMHAWSEIHSGDKSVKVGEPVDAAKLGIDDAGFAQLVESGAVREQKFPDDIGFLSPHEAAMRDLAIQAGNIEPDDVEGAGVKESATKAK